MWFYRKKSQDIQRLVASFPALVLTGARQTGKTSLLRKLFPSYEMVSLDLPSHAEMADTNGESFLRQYAPPVIIDEVQYAPKLFRYLKVAIDRNRHAYGQYILTGSQKFTLMNAVSESLAGRCAVCELETLGIDEVREHRSTPVDDLVVRGGFPELHARSDVRSADYYDAYVATYLERDVRSLLRVNQLRDFERFLRVCALRSGQVLNKSELARDVGISAPTANQWLSVLNASNQVLLLEPWFSNQTKSLIKAPKLYLSDTGLLCHLLNIRGVDDLRRSPLLGAIWETFVFAELRKTAQDRAPFHYWRDRRGLEVDFLQYRGGRFSLSEAKWSEHPTAADAANLIKVAELIGKEHVDDLSLLCRSQASYEITTPQGNPVSVRPIR